MSSFFQGLKTLSGSITNIINKESPAKSARSYEETEDPDLKQIYSGCKLLLREYLQEEESITSLSASTDLKELSDVIICKDLCNLVRKVQGQTRNNTSNIDELVQWFDLFQKHGFNYLHNLKILETLVSIHNMQKNHDIIQRSIREKLQQELNFRNKKDLDSVVPIQEDIKNTYEDAIRTVSRMLETLQTLQNGCKSCIHNIESAVAAKQTPYEKISTFSSQFAEKIVDMCLQPLREQIENAEIDRCEFELRQERFFTEEGNKSKIQKEEYKTIDNNDELLRHANEMRSLTEFFEKMVAKENEIHASHIGGHSTKWVLEEIGHQNETLAAYLKQRESELQKMIQIRSEEEKRRDIAEKQKKESLAAVGIKVRERLDWLEISQKKYKLMVQERESFIKCLMVMTSTIDKTVSTMNSIINDQLRTLREKQIAQIHEYTKFLEKRIQAKEKDQDYYNVKLAKNKEKHEHALERDNQSDARRLKTKIEQLTAKLQDCEAMLHEALTRTEQLNELTAELTRQSAQTLQ